jgi:hypothetical protein
MTINDIIKILRTQIKKYGKEKTQQLYACTKYDETLIDLFMFQYIIQIDKGMDKVYLIDATESTWYCIDSQDSVDTIFDIF